MLTALVSALGERMPRRDLEALYRDAGRRLAEAQGEHGTRGGSFEKRVRGAADLLATLGGELDVSRSDDGFTLRDLSSYERAHNDANGWHGQDGPRDNLSQNFGVEGPSERPEVSEQRRRVTRSLFATLAFVSTLTSQLLERYNYYRAVIAPRMPGNAA